MADDSPAPVRERTFTWADPIEALAHGAGLSGLEVIRAIAAGEIPSPPIARAFDFGVTEVEEGRVTFTMEPAEHAYNPIGGIHGGVIATILDSAMGCAIHTTLPVGTGYGTTDLQVRYLRGITVATGRVRAEGVVVHRGSRLATAEGRLVAEATGKLLATATTSCLISAPLPSGA